VTAASVTFLRADVLALPLRDASADQMTTEDIPSGTRHMPAMVVRLRST
jgi:hypothetical protein